MGRVKLKLKRLENNTCRQTTFSKRKNGLIKKASELSILCDIDIVLLMFSPSGKPTLFKGQNSSIEDIILKFAQLTPQERAKRKLESLEALKRTFKKLDHDVNLEEFFGPSYQSVEDLTDRVNFYRTQLSEVQNRLSYWTNLDKIEGMQHLGQMEDSLKQSISQIRAHKENLVKQQELAIQCANQFENGMHLPYDLGMEQQFQPSSWIQNDHSQNITLSTDLNLLSQRDSECSGVTSFGNCSNFFGVSEKLEMSKIGHENSSLGELCTNESLSLQMSEQQQQPSCYPSYGFGSLSGKTFQQNIHENALNFCLDANFEFPQSGYEFSHQGWAASGPEGHAIQSFDENFFPQQQHYSSDNRLASGVDNMYLQSAHHSGFAN